MNTERTPEQAEDRLDARGEVTVPSGALFERLPNFVLLGPPKCGTSSVFAWLTAHPSVCGSVRKETFYLMDPESPLCGRSHFAAEGWPGYAEFFPQDAGRFPVRMEATTHYLYQRTALDALGALDDCRVGVVLREPAARVLSSFLYTQNNLARIPPTVTFDEYVDAVLTGQRSVSELCPHAASAFVLSQDVSYGQYADHLGRWYDRLGADRMTVILFEDLVANPAAVLRRLCGELGIDPAFYDGFDFRQKNRSFQVRYRSLHRAALRARRLLPIPAAQLDAVRSYYTRLQSGRSERPRVDPSSALARLRQHYSPFNAELSPLIGRDLSAWDTGEAISVRGGKVAGEQHDPRATAPGANAPRILMIISQPPRYRAMGGVSSAAALAIETANAGATVHVLTSHETPITENLRRAGVHVHVCNGLVERWADGERPSLRDRVTRLVDVARLQGTIASLVNEHHIDLLHANDRRAFWQSSVAGALLGRPVLDVVRDTQPNLDVRRRWKWKLEFFLASRVVVLSNDMARSWSRVTGTGAGKFAVLYRIVGPDRFSPVSPERRLDLRRRLGIAANEKLLLYAAAVRPKKGQLQFITECLPTLMGTAPDATVAFVGDFTPDRDEYARACRDAVARLQLGKRARFLGYRADVADWYRAADLTLLASEKEGLARCMIESLACGTPVVSFDVASAREILEGHGCGLVVAHGAYHRLAVAAVELLGDEARRGQMAEAGRRVASGLFAPSGVASSYLAVTRRVLNGGKSLP